MPVAPDAIRQILRDANKSSRMIEVTDSNGNVSKHRISHFEDSTIAGPTYALDPAPCEQLEDADHVRVIPQRQASVTHKIREALEGRDLSMPGNPQIFLADRHSLQAKADLTNDVQEKIELEQEIDLLQDTLRVSARLALEVFEPLHRTVFEQVVQHVIESVSAEIEQKDKGGEGDDEDG